MALFEVKKQTIPSNLLSDRFIAPPFSVLNTQQGYWQERKRNWNSLGIKGEVGRSENELNISRTTTNGKKDVQMTFTRNGGLMTEEGAARFGRKLMSGASIFDPVICEISYKWFSKDNDKVLDCFAGGPVRGVIASVLKRYYTGIDLSEIQVQCNRDNYNEISLKYKDIYEPNWINGDSYNIKELVGDKKFNLLFSCPPYYNLEVYSKKAEDLSYQDTYDDFLVRYEKIIKDSCELLEDDSFAVFVVSNFRDNNGVYHNFVGDTVEAFSKAGLVFYNDAIIFNALGTVMLRAPAHFNSSRKLEKTHQNYLVFYKGNPKNIKEKFGSYEEEE